MTSEDTVLVVDDESATADGYARWLSDRYEVRTAYSGREALEKMSESVTVVLLDRRMPTITGDELLGELRDRGYDCQVAMVTAVEPDTDALDLGYDAYLVKPVSTPEKLRETVEMLSRRSNYGPELREYLALTSKKALIEARSTPSELETSEEYRALHERLRELRREVDDLTAPLDGDGPDTDVEDDGTSGLSNR